MSSEERMARSACMPGPRVSPPAPAGALVSVGGGDRNGAPFFLVGVELLGAVPAGLGGPGRDGQRDRGKEARSVAGGMEPEGLARLERGALREEQGEALKPGLADAVDLGVAGDDVGKPCLERRSQGLLVIR